VDQETVANTMQEANISAAFRFIVIVGRDQRLQLAVQGLPASAEQLLGKPALRG
jgi:hypothetical protein